MTVPSYDNTTSARVAGRFANIRAGAIGGFLVGAMVGLTVWTHTRDNLHMAVALGITLFAAVIGTLIGILMRNIVWDEGFDPGPISGADTQREGDRNT